jgi:hypothetical protein
MAKRGGQQRFAARKREQARKTRAEEKRQRKAERHANKAEGGVDPELEGIVPGPQPKAEIDEAEVAAAVARAMNPGAAAEARPPSPARAAASRLWVGNLDRGTNAEGLRQHFAGSGHEVVEADVVKDRMSGESRGFAFVDMDSPEAARQAADALDGVSLDGRPLRVRLASERPPARH